MTVYSPMCAASARSQDRQQSVKVYGISPDPINMGPSVQKAKSQGCQACGSCQKLASSQNSRLSAFMESAGRSWPWMLVVAAIFVASKEWINRDSRHENP